MRTSTIFKCIVKLKRSLGYDGFEAFFKGIV